MNTKKWELRGDASANKFKHRSLVQELRTDEEGTGIIEGYVAVWDTVDSYNSRFQRGCFKKTIQNRTNKIKVLYNHDIEQPIGKLTEIREDDHGLFVRAQLIDGVTQADDTLKLIKGGAIDCFSFGFRTVKQKFDNGIQVLTEVVLGEVSPVVFEANPASQITGVRSEDFAQTDEARELRERGWRLFSSLDITLDDIWWGDAPLEDVMGLVNKALTDFSIAYAAWTQEIIDMRSGGVRMDTHAINELSQEFRNYRKESGKTIEQIAQTSPFTVEELRSLQSGKTIADYDRISLLSDSLKVTHNAVRSEAIVTLCNELRAGLVPAEATRIEALLQKSLPAAQPAHGADEVVAYLSEFRNTLTGDK